MGICANKMAQDQPAPTICMILIFSFVFKGLPSSLEIRVPETYLEICANKMVPDQPVPKGAG